MSNLTANEIRSLFLDFFREKGHKIVPSAPIVVKDDPTLMFTNAGMNQFKDYFLGNKPAVDKRVVDTQKCLRVSGKHNDLEEVGIDTYHHTMFEMLGNWSFGDYFKKEAIAWAWELLVDVYKLPKDRLYVTVFEGHSGEKLAFDQEAYDSWAKLVEKDRILNGSKKDNFWEMGDTGPCGPCTEIHIDLRPDEERKQVDGKTLVNNDHPQVIEIWNNVFMEFNRKWARDGAQKELIDYEASLTGDEKERKALRSKKHMELTVLESLPAKHVDTGMGLERLVRALQGKTSNYDTDIFMPLIKKMAVDFSLLYGGNEKQDIAFRVIADHIRAITFCIADGQLPSNTGAGYVIRRILRRAVRYGYTFLGMHEPYIYQLVTVLAQQFKGVFPEVLKQEEFIKKVIREEEASFLRTLSQGIKRFEEELGKQSASDNSTLFPGHIAFELNDTYGFPIDLTQLLARENGLEVDMAEYHENLAQQKKRSRTDAAKEESDWNTVSEGSGQTKFLGYDQLDADVKILRYRKVSQKGKDSYQLVFDQTPFYPEGGGQVGDKGIIESELEKIEIVNTFKENDLIIQVSEKLPADLNASWKGSVNKTLRRDTANNHSATHLLHAALRKVLGTHVAQRGSLVNSEELRFDFSHFAKMSDDEIRRVEWIVNEKIRENIHLKEDRSIPFNEAVSKGAMALFGEKYGERVRMITFDPNYSIELCGGIHVPATGQIGFFKIVSEGAVAAGVRRIEAVTGTGAEKYIDTQLDTLSEIRDSLKNPKDILGAIESLREANRGLSQNLEKLKLKEIRSQVADLVKYAEKEFNGSGNTIGIVGKILNIEFPQNMDMGKTIAFDLNKKLNEKHIILLGAKSDDKVSIWLSVPKQLVKEKDIRAGEIIKQLSEMINGGGGGADTFATANGKNVSELANAIEFGREIIQKKINEFTEKRRTLLDS